MPMANYSKRNQSVRALKPRGMVSTTGTYETRIYSRVLESIGVCIVATDVHIRASLVHNPIYNSE